MFTVLSDSDAEQKTTKLFKRRKEERSAKTIIYAQTISNFFYSGSNMTGLERRTLHNDESEYHKSPYKASWRAVPHSVEHETTAQIGFLWTNIWNWSRAAEYRREQKTRRAPIFERLWQYQPALDFSAQFVSTGLRKPSPRCNLLRPWQSNSTRRSEEQHYDHHNALNVYSSHQQRTSDRRHVGCHIGNYNICEEARTENIPRLDMTHVSKYILEHQTSIRKAER